MRPTNILDVLEAVTTVAPSYPYVAAWWYAPVDDLEPSGRSKRQARSCEVVIEGHGDEPDLEGLAQDLSAQLSGRPVRVRLHRGDREGRQLFRMLSTDRPK